MANERIEIGLPEVIDFTKGEVASAGKEGSFARVSTDSRTSRPGDLFIALRGDKFDGHLFVEDALKNGAAGVVVEQAPAEEVLRKYQPVLIVVPDCLKALGDLAGGWRRKYPVPVGVLTGSNGKTTTKEMTISILGLSFVCLWSPGNFNNRIGLPKTLLTLTSDHERVVLEMGMNEPGEIGALTRIAAPNVGALLNIGPAHLERFSSIEDIAAAKGEMLTELPQEAVFVYNQEDFRLCQFAQQWPGLTKSYGTSAGCDIRLVDVSEEGVRQKIRISIEGHELSTELNLPGRHNVSNALAAAALSHSLDASPETIAEGLAKFRPVAGRFVLHRHQDFMLVDDCYNANPVSMHSALETLERISGDADRILVLGDMLELGTFSRQAHLELGRRSARIGPRLICVTGDFAQWVKQAAEAEGYPAEQIVIFDDPQKLADTVISQLRGRAWILVKGSRGMALERVVNALTERSAPLEEGAVS